MTSGRSILCAALVFMAVGAVGCSVRPSEPSVAYVQRDSVVQSKGTAAALAVDPAVVAYAPRMDLSRGVREPAAFAGYDATTTTTYTWQVDQQLYFPVYGRNGWTVGGYFDRQATVQRFTVRGR